MKEINYNYIIKKIFNISLLMLSILYVLYHAYNGSYGFKSYLNREKTEIEKQNEIDRLKEEINIISNKINKLDIVNSIDEDLLDEEIKKNTNYSNKKEIIIYSKTLENN